MSKLLPAFPQISAMVGSFFAAGFSLLVPTCKWVPSLASIISSSSSSSSSSTSRSWTLLFASYFPPRRTILSLFYLFQLSAGFLSWQNLAVMVNDAAPSPRSLGVVNGVAMTTSTASRILGPIVAGSLISYFGCGLQSDGKTDNTTGYEGNVHLGNVRCYNATCHLANLNHVIPSHDAADRIHSDDVTFHSAIPGHAIPSSAIPVHATALSNVTAENATVGNSSLGTTDAKLTVNYFRQDFVFLFIAFCFFIIGFSLMFL